jgi:hypothetical protein
VASTAKWEENSSRSSRHKIIAEPCEEQQQAVYAAKERRISIPSKRDDEGEGGIKIAIIYKLK